MTNQSINLDDFMKALSETASNANKELCRGYLKELEGINNGEYSKLLPPPILLCVGSMKASFSAFAIGINEDSDGKKGSLILDFGRAESNFSAVVEFRPYKNGDEADDDLYYPYIEEKKDNRTYGASDHDDTQQSTDHSINPSCQSVHEIEGFESSANFAIE